MVVKTSGADDSSRHLEENWFEIGVEKLFRGGTILTTAILLVAVTGGTDGKLYLKLLMHPPGLVVFIVTLAALASVLAMALYGLLHFIDGLYKSLRYGSARGRIAVLLSLALLGFVAVNMNN